MYCVKCKQKTDSLNITQTITSNNRKMMKSICSICGSKKSTFIKNESTGGGIGDILINGISKIGELHLPADKGEYVTNGSFNNLQKYSYCGPGTKYEQRVKEGYNGINELDSTCKLHDKFYNENQDTQNRNVSDVALAHRANEIASDSRYDNEQRNAARLVAIIMKNKARFGLGIQSKNLKKGPMKRK
jgi:Domain of unknown function (DUF5679)/Phospholipase A2-like domain